MFRILVDRPRPNTPTPSKFPACFAAPKPKLVTCYTPAQFNAPARFLGRPAQGPNPFGPGPGRLPDWHSGWDPVAGKVGMYFADLCESAA